MFKNYVPKEMFQKINDFLKSKKVLVLTHDLVDLDGFTSCFLFKTFITNVCKSNEVFFLFSEFSRPLKEFINRLNSRFPYVNFKLENSIDVLNIDVIVILDTNNLDQVGVTNDFDLIKLNKPFFFIDHHLNLQKNYKENVANLNLIDDSYSSSAEIIYEMLDHFNLILDVPSKILLVAAILVDSGFLQHGDNKTIFRVSKLLNDGVDYQEIISMLKIEEDISERIAKIKGLQRVALIQEGHWLIGITHVGSFEANVAASLLKFGFDIGIVCSKKKTEYRISTRANKKICLKTGLHLGKILKEISEEMGANGGGHNGAASLTGKNGINVAKDKIIDKIKQVLNK